MSARGEARRFILPGDMAKEILLSFFQAFFYENPTDFKYMADEEETEIFICDKFTFGEAAAEGRPGLYTDRGVIRWSGRHMDQFLGASGTSGARIYSDLVTVDVTVNAVSKVGEEAEYLAQLIWLLTMIFKDLLRSDRRVHNVFSTQVGRETIVKSDSEVDLSVVPVGFVLELNQAFAKFPKNPPLLEAIRLVMLDPIKVGQLKKMASS